MAKTVAVTIGHDGLIRDVTYSVANDEPGVWGMGYDFSVVKNKRIPRVDSLEIVTGKAKYTHDINRPNMLHAVMVTCPYAKASVGAIDLSDAQNMPGVVDARLAGQGKNAQYAGHLVAVIAAETPQQAIDAARKVKVSYTQQSFAAAAGPTSRDVGENVPQSVQEGRVSFVSPSNRGNVDSGFNQADAIHEAVYETQVTPHCTLETHGCVAEWNGNQLTVWISTQGIWMSQQACARAGGISASQTRVISEYMGGGFGSKLQTEDFTDLCVKMAKDTGRPVKFMASRYEDLVRCGNKPGSRQTVRIGGKKDGTLTAIDAQCVVITGYSGSDSYSAPYHDGYDCPNVRVSESTTRLNAGASRAFRAPGRPQGTYALEMAIEELAVKLDLDPVEFRMKNVGASELDCRLHALQAGAERFGWSEKFKKHGSETGILRRGVGCAITTWPYFAGAGGATARCTLYPDGGVEIANSCQDLGTGIRTAIAAAAAETLCIELENIKVLVGDTQLGLVGPMSGGSVTTSNVAPAVRSACFKAQRQVFTVVAQKWGTDLDNIVCKNSVVSTLSDPNLSMPWRDAAALMGEDPITITARDLARPTVRGVALGTQMRGAQFAEVEVNTETGRVRCLRIVAAQDCGIAMARAQAESQICGGAIMGLSYALSEDRILDNMMGRPINASMETYKLLSPVQAPEIEVVLIDVYDPVNNCSAKGLGEPPHIPTAAAVGCAVYNALGAPVRSLPITPYKVLQALKRKEG
ncbi:MAG: xanthine dehydrogenase family protein molybdopterin-binding subunit [Candidatus Omnitrophota bacterium]